MTETGWPLIPREVLPAPTPAAKIGHRRPAAHPHAGRQLSIFGVEAAEPSPADLAGLLAGPGRIDRMGGTARVSVRVDAAWRVHVLVAELVSRGLVAAWLPVATDDDQQVAGKELSREPIDSDETPEFAEVGPEPAQGGDQGQQPRPRQDGDQDQNQGRDRTLPQDGDQDQNQDRGPRRSGGQAPERERDPDHEQEQEAEVRASTAREDSGAARHADASGGPPGGGVASFEVRTAYSSRLNGLARAWPATADQLFLNGPRLRLWVAAAGEPHAGGYALGIDPEKDHAIADAALVRAGLAGLVSDDGRYYLILGRKRIRRLAELVGERPEAAPKALWPGGAAA
jgi:hypothetical protein